MKGKSLILLGLGILLLTLCPLPGSATAATEVTPLYTPPAGGTVYVLGAGMVSVTNKYLPNANFVHEAATGTLDMVRRMQQREAQKKPVFALFGSPDGFRAYKGEGEYAAKPFTTLRAVAYFNDSDQYFVVPADSPIHSYGDAKGKRIGVGPAGSTVSTCALFFFEQHGVKKADIKPYWFTFNEVVEGIENGSIDGGFLGGAFPMPSYVELSIQHNVRIVPVDEQVFKRIAKDHPYYYRRLIKAKSYKGLERDTPVYGFTGVIFTHAGVSNERVYAFLKNLWEHRNDYYAIHKSAKDDFVFANLTKGLPVPLHPGAEKYLREIGALK